MSETHRVRVEREPRTYSRDSPHSFFKDAAASVLGSDPDAQARLDRHHLEVDREVALKSEEGRRVVRELADELRGEYPNATTSEREARATTTGSAAGFVTPQYLIKEFAVFRGTQRPFTEQCTKLPLPDVGLAIHIPSFTAASSAGVQATEGTAVGEVDPTGADLTEPVRTIVGQITTSQQTLDRTQSTPDGFTFDMFLYAQLRQNYDQSVENYVLGKALANGKVVPGTTVSPWIDNFYSDVTSAREVLEDTAGLRIIPTHVFTTPDLLGYATHQLDLQKRPLLLPQFFPGVDPVTGEDDEKWSNFTGIVLPGNLIWFMDAAIQPVGANTQIIVSRPDTIVVMEQPEPITRLVAAPVAATLQVVAQLYSYVCCIPRYPGATASITGSGYATTLI